MLLQKMIRHRLIQSKERWQPVFICLIGLCVSLLAVGVTSLFAQNLLDEPIETLETIEVPATIVVTEERKFSIPEPDVQNIRAWPDLITPIPGEPVHSLDLSGIYIRVFVDEIAKTKAVRTTVRPAKAEHPPYPRFAREQGWEGTVVLRVRINHSGLVDTVKTQKTSGYPLLDDSAMQSVKSWTFEPAKDGEFPIPVTVDLPIRFDLDE